jgi:thioredoxin 1
MTELTDETFEEAIKEGLVLLDFHALWCGPCKMLSPVLEALEKTFDQKVKFFKANIDDCPDSAEKMGVRAIPTLVLLRSTIELDRKVGGVSESDLKSWLEDAVGEIPQ